MTNVSIVIPLFNSEKYISSCLESVLNQTLKEIEVIVVDDGSSDNSLCIVEEFSKNDNRVKIIKQKNRGVLAARGVGYRAARGEYIFSLDSDDWIEAHTCETLYKNAKSENADMIICNYISEYNNQSIKSSISIFDRILDGNQYSKLYFSGKISSYVWVRLIKKELLMYVDYEKNINMGDDTFINISIIDKVNKVIKINDYLVHYRIRNNSITKKYDQSILEIKDIIENLDPRIIKEYKSEIEYFIFNHVFISRLLDRRDMNYKIHKKLFNYYQTKKINILKNKYFQQQISKKHKVMTYSYRLNYEFGFLVTRFINELVYYIKIKNKKDYQD